MAGNETLEEAVRGSKTGQMTLSAYGSNPIQKHDGENEHGYQVGRNYSDFSTERSTLVSVYDEETADYIISKASEIDKLEENTIYNLRRRGELPKEANALVASLGHYDIDANNLTVDEAIKVSDYAHNKTDDIIRKKTDRIYDAQVRHINSINSRHDGREPAFFNEQEYIDKLALQEKFVAWDRGEYSTEKGFDVDAAYQRLLGSGVEDPSGALKRHLEEEDFEDLYDEGLVDYDMCFTYGPFTEKDIADAKIYQERTWTDITNSRYMQYAKGKAAKDQNGSHDETKVGKSLSDLLNETIRPGSMNVETDLIHDFVANEILQSRRLKARELAMTASAIALQTLDIKDADDNVAKQTLKDMRRSVKYMGYYLGMIFDRKKTEMKERFGSTMPLSAEFFEEIANESKNLSEARAEYLEEHYRPILTKLDEHLHNLLYDKKAMSELFVASQEPMDEYD